MRIVPIINHVLIAAIVTTLLSACAHAPTTATPSARIHDDTPQPTRFVVRDASIVDLRTKLPVFFRGIGYSPYLPHETPLTGAEPGNDGRYAQHLPLLRDMNANYLHVFPMKMPANFFAELDKTDLVYGQDIWVEGRTEDFLDEAFLTHTSTYIKGVIDHAYKVGRPDRLVLFSIGDELQAKGIVQTNERHPTVRDFVGKHMTLHNRTPTEIAVARLIDGAMDHELTTYGRRHLYCHTSWTHVGPIADRPDIEVPTAHVLTPDIGDLMCLNIYTYANGVRTSPPGSATGTTYQGYLEQLARTTNVPIFVTQVGLSTSPIAPKPWVPGFGGHRIDDVPKTFRAVWNDVRTAVGHDKFCGIAFFEFQDEWWKSGEDPTDMTRHEDNDPEEWFGLYEVRADHSLTAKGDIPATVRELFGER